MAISVLWDLYRSSTLLWHLGWKFASWEETTILYMVMFQALTWSGLNSHTTLVSKLDFPFRIVKQSTEERKANQQKNTGKTRPSHILGCLLGVFVFEAGRPPECSFLLIYEIEISQVITSFHHHIKTWNLTIYFNALFPEVNLFHWNQLAFII